MSDLHDYLYPYDGTERVFSSLRPSGMDRRVIEAVLRRQLQPNWILSEYDISIYSGGIGVIEEMVVQVQMPQKDFEDYVTERRFQDIAQLYTDNKAGELIWLFGEEESADFAGFLKAARSFLKEKKLLQSFSFNPDTAIFCEADSDVNAYDFLFYSDGSMFFVAFSQG
ncbi:MAG: hypothetical protein MUD08_08260 [Cytophagales bacterium]|nr:hypothetical protein [Cytophagales bacterium]